MPLPSAQRMPEFERIESRVDDVPARTASIHHSALRRCAMRGGASTRWSIGALLMTLSLGAFAMQNDIPGPPGSVAFGKQVIVLPNGNIVVGDPERDAGRGAVYLYSASGTQISMLVGSTPGDHVGGGEVIVLSNGHYVVRSPDWDNGAAVDAGAVSFGHASTGVAGTVGPSNSLVGTHAGDRIGSGGIVALAGGHYVVGSPAWDRDAIVDAGAASFGDGSDGVTGPITAINSLVGGSDGDKVGSAITALKNGHYVVQSPTWRNGSAANAGAATWGNGKYGIAGEVSIGNSQVGSSPDDRIGLRVTALSTGHYVIASTLWDHGSVPNAGVATFGIGTGGSTGIVSAANSLVGSRANDRVGVSVTALTNGSYVVASPFWTDKAISSAGAVTWCLPTGSTVGPVSTDNSLFGASTEDQIGIAGVAALSNGNYVVMSPFWDAPEAFNAGAATFGNGKSGVVGAVSAANSLIGTAPGDSVGDSVTALGNGHYVVVSPYWDDAGVADVGAVTWGDGVSGSRGTVSRSNSLFGTTADDRVGDHGVFALKGPAGHYLVASADWDTPSGMVNAGAATWGNGQGGVIGQVSSANSLVGMSANDRVGDSFGIAVLSNGHYVVASPLWDNGGIVNAGAVTWGNGTSGTRGKLDGSLSLVGAHAYDHVGLDIYSVGPHGQYAIASNLWDDDVIADAGAITLVDGSQAYAGSIAFYNSVRGAVANENVPESFDYDASARKLVVGRSRAGVISQFAADVRR